jgi:hypothetical protein
MAVSTRAWSDPPDYLDGRTRAAFGLCSPDELLARLDASRLCAAPRRSVKHQLTADGGSVQPDDHEQLSATAVSKIAALVEADRPVVSLSLERAVSERELVVAEAPVSAGPAGRAFARLLSQFYKV